MDDFNFPPDQNDQNPVDNNLGSNSPFDDANMGDSNNPDGNNTDANNPSIDESNQGLTNSNIFGNGDSNDSETTDSNSVETDQATDEGSVDNGTVPQNIIKLSGFPEITADYIDDSSQYESELKRARLKQSELDKLKDLDLSSSVPSIEQKQLLARLLQLGFYAVKLGKTQALDALLAKVHPTIAKAMRMTLVEFVSANALAAANANTEGAAIDFAAENEAARQAANNGNFSRARDIWSRLAQVGNAEAQTALGLMFARGDGVDRDYNQAYNWFSQAGEKGDNRALFAMGKMHFYGDGVTRDKQVARQYIERAAESGNVEARAFLKKLN